jgi:hypothetical protein
MSSSFFYRVLKRLVFISKGSLKNKRSLSGVDLLFKSYWIFLLLNFCLWLALPGEGEKSTYETTIFDATPFNQKSIGRMPCS